MNKKAANPIVRLAGLALLVAVAVVSFVNSLGAAEPRRVGETSNQWPPLVGDKTFLSAAVDTEGDVLKVSTGVMERRWKLTDRGPVTISFKNIKTGFEWIQKKPDSGCDFAPAGFSGNLACTALSVKKDNDQGFTADHLAVTVEFQDPKTKAEFRWVIWAYPDAVGLRTRLSVRRLPKLDEVNSFEIEGVVDSLPVISATGARTGDKEFYAWTPPPLELRQAPIQERS